MAEQHNAPLSDIASALTGSLPRNGTAAMLADLPMGGRRARNMADGTLATDAATKGQVDAVTVSLDAAIEDLGEEITTQIATRVPTTRTITAGNGLTGGGALDANRTVSMGTPGTLNYDTGNSASGTTHTHDVDYVMPGAGVIGSYVFCRSDNGPINPGDVVAGSTLQWADTVSGFVPGSLGSGSYRCMGYIGSVGARTNFQRIA